MLEAGFRYGIGEFDSVQSPHPQVPTCLISAHFSILFNGASAVKTGQAAQLIERKYPEGVY
jgi:hypothetical protein